MKSSISRRLPTMLSIAFGEAGWRHPEGRFNIEPVCCSCSGRLGVTERRDGKCPVLRVEGSSNLHLKTRSTPMSTTTPTSPLRRRMIEDMTVRGFGEKTQSDYIRHAKNFTIFLGRSPDTAEEDLRAFPGSSARAGGAAADHERCGGGAAVSETTSALPPRPKQTGATVRLPTARVQRAARERHCRICSARVVGTWPSGRQTRTDTPRPLRCGHALRAS